MPKKMDDKKTTEEIKHILMMAWNLFALSYLFGIAFKLDYASAAVTTLFFCFSALFTIIILVELKNRVKCEVKKWNKTSKETT